MTGSPAVPADWRDTVPLTNDAFAVLASLWDAVIVIAPCALSVHQKLPTRFTSGHFNASSGTHQTYQQRTPEDVNL